MPHEHVLVVDDEEDILELVRYNLERDGFVVSCVTTGEDALEKVKTEHPDIILLDLMLPGVDGLEVCTILKNDRETAGIPILMLTAKGEETDIVAGFELGADDYIKKPFSPRILVARIKTVLRRRDLAGANGKSVIEVKDLVIHPGRYEVMVKGKQVSLTTTEFNMLHMLAKRPGWVFTRQQLIDASRGQDYPVTDRSVDVHIVGLRKKLGELGKNIETVRGVGYRFRER